MIEFTSLIRSPKTNVTMAIHGNPHITMLQKAGYTIQFFIQSLAKKKLYIP
jgi:hypothetical protein